MDGKRSNPVLFFFLLFIFMIYFSNAELQQRTLFLNVEDARLALSKTLYQTAASDLDSQPSAKTLTMEMVRIDHITAAANKKISHSKRIETRLKRDRMRATYLSIRATNPSPTANGTVISGYSNGIGEYLTRLGVGSPPQLFYMILDTGSDITWLQCRPCKQCYKQKDTIYNRNESNTYSELPCNSKTCMLLDLSRCSNNSNKCQYKVSYGDGSLTVGDFSTETLTFGKRSIAGIAIGCGYYNRGLMVYAAGLLGLGRGKLSFPNQISQQQYSRKFSYCLVSQGSNDTSIITFGDAGVSKKTNFTRMITNKAKGLDTFYYVKLKGISVGGVRVKGVKSAISKIDKNGNSGVIIDSGTSVTYLEVSAYNATRDAFRKANKKLKHELADTSAEISSAFDTCYDFPSLRNVSVPSVALHFSGGARMDLPADNYLIQLDNALFCFAFRPTKGMSIIGNTQQQGFGMMYDLEAKQIGFTPQSC